MVVLPSLLKPWTPVEDPTRKRNWFDMNDAERLDFCKDGIARRRMMKELAEEVGCHPRSIGKFLDKWGLELWTLPGQHAKYRHSEWGQMSIEARKEALRLGHKNGMTLPTLAAKLGCSQTVIRAFHRNYSPELDFDNHLPNYEEDVANRIRALANGEMHHGRGAAKALGIDHAPMMNWARAHGVVFKNSGIVRRAVARGGKPPRRGRCANVGGWWAQNPDSNERLKKIRTLFDEGLGLRGAARAVGISESSLQKYLKARGMSNPVIARIKEPTEEQLAQFRELCSKPIGYRQLAKTMHVSYDVLKRWASQHGITIISPPAGKTPGAPSAPRKPRAPRPPGESKPKSPRVYKPRPKKEKPLDETLVLRPKAPPQPPANRPAPDVATRVHMLADHLLGKCRFPLWPDFGEVPLSEKFYCGAPTAHEKTTYCENCLRLTHGRRLMNGTAQFMKDKRAQRQEKRSVFQLRSLAAGRG
jgi:transposase-like protein